MQKTIHLSYPGPEDNNSIVLLSLTVSEDIEGLIYSTKTNSKFPKQYTNQHLPTVPERIFKTFK